MDNETVVHAVPDKVVSSHVLDFCRCDSLFILRVQENADLAVMRAKKFIGTPYDFDFESG